MTAIPPVAELTWQFNVNQAVTGRGPCLYALKQALINPAWSNPWTVMGSSNGVTYTFGGADLWVDAASAYTFINPRGSWIVLQNVDEVKLIIRLVETSKKMYMYWYTGPLIATVDADFYPNLPQHWAGVGYGAWFTNGDNNMRLHVMMDTTGKHTRVIACIGGNVYSIINISAITPAQGVTLEANYLVACHQMDGASLSPAQLMYPDNEQNGITIIEPAGAGNCQRFVVPSWEGYGRLGSGDVWNATTRTTAMASTGNWALGAISGFWSKGGAASGKYVTTHSSSVSALADTYMGSSDLANGSAYFNTSGQIAWAQFAGLVFPWDGSVPLTT